MANKGASLLQGQVLNGDDYLLSPNGLYVAYMQDDGNFVLYHTTSTQPPNVDWSRPYWSTGTSIRQQGFAKMQTDGNFVLYHGTASNQGSPYWASNTNRGAGSYHLDMQSDGNLVVYNGSTPIWASNTNWVSQQVTSGVPCLQTGQWMSNDTYLVSPNGQYVALMQDDSNFVLYHATSTQPPNPDWSRPYWSVNGNASSNLGGKAQGGKYVARMQDDGNFVLYNGTDPGHFSGPYWASHTNRGAGSYHLDMQSDGNLVVYNGSTPLWASNTVVGVGERLNIVSGNNQTQPRFLTVAGDWPAHFAPLSVVFTDSVGNPYAGKNITWTFYTPNWQMLVEFPTFAGGMQTSIPVTTTTDSHGNATLNNVSAWTTDGSDGSFTIVAKSDSGLSVTFNLTIGDLRSVVSGTILAGNNQSVARSPNAGFDVPVAVFAPLQVKVFKPDGTPAVGVRVGFVTGSNPNDIVTTTMNVDYNTVTTDGSGIATLSSVTAYDRTGTFTVVASIEGGNQLTFSETVSS